LLNAEAFPDPTRSRAGAASDDKRRLAGTVGTVSVTAGVVTDTTLLSAVLPK